MMRVASLLLALSLFTSAATACAEYAWVLWGAQRADEAVEEARVWWILGAHFTQPDCERVVMQYAECDFPTTYLSNASPTPWARTLSAC